MPYNYEAAVICAFYGAGVIVFACLAMFCIKETEYFNGEDDVVIPKHVLEEHVLHGVDDSREGVEFQDVETKAD